MRTSKRFLVVAAVLAASAAPAFAADPVYGSAEVDAALTALTALKGAVIALAAGFLAWKLGTRLISRFVK